MGNPVERRAALGEQFRERQSFRAADSLEVKGQQERLRNALGSVSNLFLLQSNIRGK